VWFFTSSAHPKVHAQFEGFFLSSFQVSALRQAGLKLSPS
jgi:hypothetical protein